MLLSKLFRPVARVVRSDVSLRFLSTVVVEAPAVDINVPIIEKRKKHKVPQKRASSLLNILQQEEKEILRNGREYPKIHAGDSIEIEKLLYLSSKEPFMVRGVVLGVYNKNSDTSITMLNIENGTPITRNICIYSPMVVSIKILQKAFIHNGKKRVRRSKLYYLADRDVEEYTVKYDPVIKPKLDPTKPAGKK